MVINKSDSYTARVRGFGVFNNLCIEYDVIGLSIYSRIPHAGPPIAVVFEIATWHDWTASFWDRNIGTNVDMWLLHAVITRCMFGPTSKFGGWTNKGTIRHYGERIQNFGMSGDGLQGTQVLTSVVEDQANHEDPSISFPQIIAGRPNTDTTVARRICFWFRSYRSQSINLSHTIPYFQDSHPNYQRWYDSESLSRHWAVRLALSQVMRIFSVIDIQNWCSWEQIWQYGGGSLGRRY